MTHKGRTLYGYPYLSRTPLCSRNRALLWTLNTANEFILLSRVISPNPVCYIVVFSMKKNGVGWAMRLRYLPASQGNAWRATTTSLRTNRGSGIGLTLGVVILGGVWLSCSHPLFKSRVKIGGEMFKEIDRADSDMYIVLPFFVFYKLTLDSLICMS
ncbi:hypothetical protein F5Y17DRAFT_149091 [Xylariaceae sp. FL0594]|nr:hypothetical protein F5Y17DRAFT_149091 [Xylariaceae sp. FL0594]